MYPGATHDDVFEHEVDGKRVDGHQSRLRDRFSLAQDALHLALRERYVSTLLAGWAPSPGELEPLVASANAIQRRQRVARAQAERIDWSLAKRCIEQAAAIMVRDLGRDGDLDEEALANLADPRFVTYGHDLEQDKLEDSAAGDATAAWTIDAAATELVLTRRVVHHDLAWNRRSSSSASAASIASARSSSACATASPGPPSTC